MNSAMLSSAPISVMLPTALRARLSAQAQRRSLKLSTALRVLLDERLSDLEAEEQLSRAEEWQRAQVWASWERYQQGENREVPWEDLQALFDAALGRGGQPKSGSPKTSRPTSKRKSRG